MKTKYSKILYFCLPVMFAACEQVIDFEGDRPDNKVILNAVIGCDEDSHNIFLTRSAFIFSSDEVEAIDGLPVEVSINGDMVAEVENQSSGRYVFKAALKTGDKVEISVPDNLPETVKAIDIVPEPPVIVSVDSVRFYDYTTGSVLLRTLIKIKDKPGEKNYYRLLIKTITIYDEGDKLEYRIEKEILYSVSQDIILSGLSREGKEDDNNLSRIFPDDLFSGEEYTLNVFFPVTAGSAFIEEKTEVEIELQSLSESLYLYMRSLEQKWNSDIFDQPTKIYSNVNGGYGILGLYSSCKKTIILNKDEVIPFGT
ncbi:MAG: DUF4249 domain-containing protein, partial [Prevotellaceae bacterium]|nr:DUF4249 domain-containing protein [Prevotellaceae bacterium]